VHEGAEFCEWKSELFSVHWIGKIKVFWYDDFARRRNFSALELQVVLK
jgi:hypothetical protein